MASIKESLETAMEVTGAVAVALVDMKSGLLLGGSGNTAKVNLDLAAAGNAEVVKAKLRTVQSLKLNDSIEDILITLGKQYHLIRLVEGNQGLFLYMVLDKEQASLALARLRLKEVESSLSVI